MSHSCNLALSAGTLLYDVVPEQDSLDSAASAVAADLQERLQKAGGIFLLWSLQGCYSRAAPHTSGAGFFGSKLKVQTCRPGRIAIDTRFAEPISIGFSPPAFFFGGFSHCDLGDNPNQHTGTQASTQRPASRIPSITGMTCIPCTRKLDRLHPSQAWHHQKQAFPDCVCHPQPGLKYAFEQIPATCAAVP